MRYTFAWCANRHRVQRMGPMPPDPSPPPRAASPRLAVLGCPSPTGLPSRPDPAVTLQVGAHSGLHANHPPIPATQEPA